MANTQPTAGVQQKPAVPLRINGSEHVFEIERRVTLLDALREYLYPSQVHDLRIGASVLLRSEARDAAVPDSDRLKGEITAARGLLFVTAEYNRSIPGVFKNAIDHASRPYGKNVWAGRTGWTAMSRG